MSVYHIKVDEESGKNLVIFAKICYKRQVFAVV